MNVNGSEIVGASTGAKKAKPAWRRLFRLAVLVGLGYVAWCFALFFKQGDMIFPRSYANRPLKSVPGGVDVWTRDVDGVRMEAWFLAGAGRTAESPGPAVMLFHGNAELIDNWMSIAEEYARRGFSVLLPEYRGMDDAAGRLHRA